MRGYRILAALHLRSRKVLWIRFSQQTPGRNVTVDSEAQKELKRNPESLLTSLYHYTNILFH